MNEALLFGTAFGLYLLLMWKAGKTFPILYLFIFIYFIQYIFSTYLIYNEYKVLSYQMPIPQEAYFKYSILACAALFAGTLLFAKDINLRDLMKKINPQEASRLGYLLLFISLFFDFLPYAGIDLFSSITSFTSYLKYLAAFCFLFTRSTVNYLIIALIYAQLGVIVLRSGVFVSFFIWAMFLFFFVSLKYSISYLIRSLVLLVFIPILVVIQGVKHEYREKVWKDESKGGLGLLSDLAQKQQKEEDDPIAESTGVTRTVGRLSQGWHLGMTLKQVPKKEPIAQGVEMWNDVVASILPRAFFEDKKSVNSKDKFSKYTGHKLRGSTSMSIGILGDFYINYGWWGSIVALFIFGALIARLVYIFIKRYVLPDPINIIWVPFILSYLIRANNDFYIFFNCLVKGYVIFLAINFIRYYMLGARKPHLTAIKPEVL
jgi:hypothetical protein